MIDPQKSLPDKSWTIDLLQPGDAPGVAALFLSVYGDQYPLKAYLDPETLIRENKAGHIVSSVAKTPEGKIIGHNALFNSAPCNRVYEVGAGVVHKDYRGGHGIFTQLVRHCTKVKPHHLCVEQAFGEPVCNHPYSQRMCLSTGYLTRALEINLMPAEAYAMENSAQGRVSALLDFLTLTPRPCTVHVPGAYEALFPFFYADMKEDRHFAPGDQALPSLTLTQVHTRVFDFAQVARISMPALGEDLTTVYPAEESRLLQEGIRVIQVWLPTGVPFVGRAVDLLREMGYFLGGVLPRWFDTDGILMQKVIDLPDWDSMVLYSPRAREMMEIVRSDYQSVTGGFHEKT